MPPRTLASLAHALTVSASPDAALQALGEALAEVDRFAQMALVTFDERRGMLRERVLPSGLRATLETTFDHLPTRERNAIAAGGQFVDFGESGDEFARLLQVPSLGEAGWLNVRGLRSEGQLSALLVLYETRKMFGARTAERFLTCDRAVRAGAISDFSNEKRAKRPCARSRTSRSVFMATTRGG